METDEDRQRRALALLHEVISTLGAISGALMADTRAIHDSVREIPVTAETRGQIEFHIRNHIRAFFAQVEGTAYAMRQAALRASDEGFLRLTDAERFLLMEKRYRSKNGEARESSDWLKPLEGVDVAFNFYPKIFGLKFALNRGAVGYERFQETLRIRDRITHPKQVGDLSFSSAEIRAVAEAMKWHFGEMARLLAATLDALGGSTES